MKFGESSIVIAIGRGAQTIAALEKVAEMGYVRKTDPVGDLLD